jgi:hypothetical protein
VSRFPLKCWLCDPKQQRQTIIASQTPLPNRLGRRMLDMETMAMDHTGIWVRDLERLRLFYKA